MGKNKEQEKAQTVYSRLRAYNPESGSLNTIIETPKGSRGKYDYDEALGLFKLGSALPCGSVFPYDFGYVPETLGEDGDPLDVLILMDEPAFVGCLVEARLIGVIEAKQTEDDKTFRNDRLIAVADGYNEEKNLKSLSDLSDYLVDEIEHFFVSYNETRNKVFKPLGRFGPGRAKRLVKEGIALFKKEDAGRINTQKKKK